MKINLVGIAVNWSWIECLDDSVGVDLDQVVFCRPERLVLHRVVHQEDAQTREGEQHEEVLTNSGILKSILLNNIYFCQDFRNNAFLRSYNNQTKFLISFY